MKVAPVIAMGLIIGLSIWIMSSIQSVKALPLQPGATAFEVVITSRKVLVEQMPTKVAGVDGSEGAVAYSYRFLNAQDLGSATMNEKEFQETLSRVASAQGRSWILQILNVSAYNKLWWPALGFLGQLVFAGRMWVQWLTSEKQRKSVVPPVFWYMSLVGGLISATYFIWRQDLVGVIGQTSGIWIYARNVYLLRLAKAQVEPREGAGEDE